jgi:hypothetical protein
MMAALVLVGNYLHIWYKTKHAWGYEIWIWTAGGVWGLDRLIRIARLASNGLRQAVVSKIDDDYIKVDVEGVVAHGYAYVYFPTLSWRFWENHPFSVISTFASDPPVVEGETSDDTGDNKEMAISSNLSIGRALSAQSLHAIRAGPFTGSTRPRVSLVMRIRGGTTGRLATRLTSSTPTYKIPVLIESSYGHQPRIMDALGRCSSIVLLAGGVGIGTMLPLVHRYDGVRIRLCWGVRKDTLPLALETEISKISPLVRVERKVGSRLNLRAILEEELLGTPRRGIESGSNSDAGDVAIVVSGPESMADEARALICELGKRKGCKGFAFVDEAFSW